MNLTLPSFICFSASANDARSAASPKFLAGTSSALISFSQRSRRCVASERSLANALPVRITTASGTVTALTTRPDNAFIALPIITVPPINCCHKDISEAHRLQGDNLKRSSLPSGIEAERRTIFSFNSIAPRVVFLLYNAFFMEYHINLFG
jgi:hypothetical protein